MSNQKLHRVIQARHLKKPLSKSIGHPPSNQGQSKSNYSKFLVLIPSLLVLLCTSDVECASLSGSSRERLVNNDNLPSPQHSHLTNYRFLQRHNEHDSGVGILDNDGVLKLSLAIDDESPVSAPSLHTLEPKVHLRVSGESGTIPQPSRKKDSKLNIQFHLESKRKSFQAGEEEEDRAEEEEEEEEEDDMMNDNYHHHFPYIESYREKYLRLDPAQFQVTTPRTTLPSSSKSTKQEWSEIIAQVTTPSSFNEINSSASEHRLADYHLRGNLPYYYFTKYHTYSEEDLENVADLDDEHSKYFVKTRPRSRSVATSASNIYSNFYYEPPSFSTKSVSIPVKTGKEAVVFASSSDSHHSSFHDHDLELPQQDAPVTISSSNYTEAKDHANYVKEGIKPDEDSIQKSDSSPINNPSQTNYFEEADGTQKHSASNNQNAYLLKPSAPETLDVSTSQSILSKVTLNHPHLFHHPQFVIIKADPQYIKTATVTPHDHDDNDEITLTSIKLASAELENQNNEPNSDHSEQTTTETSTEPPTTTISTTPSSSTPTSTTTDATSIPGIPGVDYPTLGEIPQTSFDCKNQRYKGFFADIDTKCQAWHYCDFTDSHSTFLCPNGTLFSQVLLTCDWWFNVDCDQARQLYVLNERLYRYIKPPKPSFPEDFVGEHVDKWLLQQFTDGYLPKVRKKSKAKFVTLPPPTSSSTPTQENE